MRGKLDAGMATQHCGLRLCTQAEAAVELLAVGFGSSVANANTK